MKYALHLSDENRILSTTFEQFASGGDIVVEALPDDDVTDYKYVDGTYIYDPVEKEPEAEPTTTVEERVTDLEEAFEMILSGVTE